MGNSQWPPGLPVTAVRQARQKHLDSTSPLSAHHTQVFVGAMREKGGNLGNLVLSADLGGGTGGLQLSLEGRRLCSRWSDSLGSGGGARLWVAFGSAVTALNSNVPSNNVPVPSSDDLLSRCSSVPALLCELIPPALELSLDVEQPCLLATGDLMDRPSVGHKLHRLLSPTTRAMLPSIKAGARCQRGGAVSADPLG